MLAGDVLAVVTISAVKSDFADVFVASEEER
jgi:hypothetical protein